MDGLLPEEHPARFVWSTLPDLDFGELEAQYLSVQGWPGRSPYDPRLLVALWIYGMMVGLETAAALAESCRLRDDFKWLAGGLYPCDQTLLNIVTRGRTVLVAIWIQLLQAMANAGLIDLSVVVEDGTKVRANAGPRSFHTLDGIAAEIGALKDRLEQRLDRLVQEGATIDRKTATELTGLRGRLKRAEHAEQELRARIQKRRPQTRDESAAVVARASSVFGADAFQRHPDRDVLTCPAGEELRLIGEYHDGGRGARYRLYGRSDCTGCPLKDKCTRGRCRRVKLPVEAVSPPETPSSSAEPDEHSGEETKPSSEDGDKTAAEPTASLRGSALIAHSWYRQGPRAKSRRDVGYRRPR
ncbi:transposase [Myxococcota bacterium]|nr:transposase [Myxococcota bacterium]